jgi:hypothetical protein
MAEAVTRMSYPVRLAGRRDCYLGWVDRAGNGSAMNRRSRRSNGRRGSRPVSPASGAEDGSRTSGMSKNVAAMGPGNWYTQRMSPG